MSDGMKLGQIGWIDLTVQDAEGVRDFYAAVAGWTHVDVEVEGHSDYAMVPPGAADPAAGICHQLGANANIPSQWLMYITVLDLPRAITEATGRGGVLVDGPREDGQGNSFAVLRGLAGEVFALWQEGQTPG